MTDSPNVVPIPGGRARLRDPGTLTERQRRPLKTLTTALGVRRLQEIMAASAQTTEGLAVEIDLTEHETDIMMRMTDAVIFATLEEWSLKIPLPDSIDAVQDIPGPVYDALARGTARLGAALMAGAGSELQQGDPDTPPELVDTFSVAAVENPGSPTEASAD